MNYHSDICGVGTGRLVKSYICPYCGKKYSDDLWTYDHIIPQDLGGPRSYKIIACKKCNNDIGRLIEQKAMRTSALCDLLGSTIVHGNKVQLKRKKQFLPAHRGIGVACGEPAKMYWDIDEKSLSVAVFSRECPDLATLNHGSFISLADTDDREDLALVKFASKIVLGTAAWIWGDLFSDSPPASVMRERVWNNKFESIEKLDGNQKHITAGGLSSSISGSTLHDDSDAFDNYPHHTIGIFDDGHIGFTYIVNLFGSYESMGWIRGCKDNKFFEKEQGYVVIAHTTENKIQKLTLDEYAKALLKRKNSEV